MFFPLFAILFSFSPIKNHLVHATAGSQAIIPDQWRELYDSILYL